MPPPAPAEAPQAGTSAAPGGVRAPAYRPDIDGLRALAVIAVILFHGGVGGLGGGYVGVDVFFVISGYLITQLLEGSREAPGRMLASFYLRRIRRILPALFVMCLVTAVAGAILFLPEELTYLGKYLAATAVLSSNLANWTEGGYFAHLGDDAPLSHLWSIAVEEQFYLFYPLLLLIITRYLPARRRATLIALASASLALCVWASHYKPGANYFLAPTRAWELLLGAALALGGAPRIRPRLGNEALAVASLLGLAIAVHLYTAHMPYPGTAAILPCMATAVLIATGAGPRPAFANQLLSWRPLVFVGLISYSLYLWHQPLLVLVSYYRIEPYYEVARLGPAALALELAALTLLAVVSWRFVERPIRSRVLLKTPRALLVTAALSSAVILLVGLVFFNSDGLPQRFSPQTRALLPEVPGGPVMLRCMDMSVQAITSGRLCSAGSSAGPGPTALVWGDSHALALMPAYEALAIAHHMHLYFVGRSSCLPLLAATNRFRPDAVPGGTCPSVNAAVVGVIARLDPQIVILGGRWIDAEIPAGVADIATGIEQTARQVDNGARTVCVVLGVPELKYRAPYALVMARRRHMADDFLTVSRSDALAQYRDMERAVRAIAQRSRFKLVDPKDALCPGDQCLYKAHGHSLYYDANHLSPEGARYVAPALEPCFELYRRP